MPIYPLPSIPTPVPPHPIAFNKHPNVFFLRSKRAVRSHRTLLQDTSVKFSKRILSVKCLNFGNEIKTAYNYL